MAFISSPKIKKEAYILDIDKASDINTEPVIPELVEDLIIEARTLLNKELNARDWSLTPEVIADLIGWYEKMVARLSNSLLIQRYSSFFLTVYPFWRPKNALPGDSEPNSPREKLDTYISWEKEQEVFTDSGPYPELSRLIKLHKKNWISASLEMIERLIKHKHEIAVILDRESATIEQLTGITFGISDPHNESRTAAVLAFGKGKLIYKPRSLDGEYGWNYIIKHLHKNGFEYDFYLPKILRCKNYGFMEFIKNTSCDNASQVESCYEKYGAIIAISHAFGTYDLHHENIIVTKDSPVVIDAEPLFRCILGHSEQGENRLKLDKSISLEDINSKESVVDIGMLPYSLINQLNEEEGKYEDYIVGALHPFGIETMKEHVPSGRGSNNLQLLESKMKATSFPNLPNLEGKPQLPKDFVDQIERGFKYTHKFLNQKRDKFLNEDQLLNQLVDLDLRLLVRPTMQYGLVFLRSLSAELLVSKEKRREKVIEDLRLLGRLRLDDIGNIEEIEVNDILNGDIPRFDVVSNETQVFDTPLMFSPLTLAKERYERLDEIDLELQITTIREKILDKTKAVFESKHKSLESDLQLKHAFEVTELLVDSARFNGKDPFWAFTAYAPGYGSTMVHADREAFYDGSIGTAVTIAEAAKLKNDSQWMDLSKAVFNPILEGETPESIYRGGGLARGLGGLIYSMLRIYDASNDAEFLKVAGNLAIRHSNYVMKHDELDEVLHGRAGLLLAMIALYKRNPMVEFELIIHQIANTLIERSVSHDNGICWKVLDGHSLPNMSHGTSGIAMALARYYELYNNADVKRVIEGALEYDNSFWDQKEKGWLDARVADIPNEQSSTWTWCNGRSGALLSRLAVSKALGTSFENDKFVKLAVEAGINDIMKDASPGLCCGTPGLVDVLIKINKHTQNENIDKYVKNAVNVISLNAPKDHYSNLTPALFTGTAGLVFSMLRASKPDDVSSLLWFE